MRPTEKFAYFKAAAVLCVIAFAFVILKPVINDYAHISAGINAQSTGNNLSVSNRTDQATMPLPNNQFIFDWEHKIFKGSGAHPVIIVVFATLIYLIICKLLTLRL